MDQPYVQVAQAIVDDARLLDLPAAYRWALLELAVEIARHGPVDQTRARKLRLGSELPRDVWERLLASGAAVERDGCLFPAPELTNVVEQLEHRRKISRVRSEAGRKGAARSIQTRRQTPSFASNLPGQTPNNEQANGRHIEVEGEEEVSPSLRSGETDGASTPTRPRAMASDLADELKARLLKERAIEVARHWSDLTGKTTPLKRAQAVAAFEVPLPQLFDCLDRCHGEGSYDLASPVIRMTLQRLESELRKVEGQRLGQVSVGERLSVISGRGGAGATA